MEPEINDSSTGSYWSSVILASVIFGLIAFALTIGAGYYTINSQPTNSTINPSTLVGAITCLFTAFGGMLAVWHYTRAKADAVTLGKGALIGLLTGVIIGLLNLFLSNIIWPLIDPSYTNKIIDATMQSMQARGMSQEQLQKMSDMMRSGSVWRSIGYIVNVVIFAFLNMITGMVGARMFSEDKEQQ